jgi:3-oxoacyl-(acyl-carrier-protein) synthase/SAM-dependent methyltransferase/acyl carrier protein
MSNFLEKIRALSPKQLMLLALEQHDQLESASRHEPIAIIGMACRFPGAETPEAFWRLLDEGRTAIREVPADRWDSAQLFDADRDAPGRIAVRAAGFLDDIAGFDAAFFGIAPREAASMDPQQRLLLEVAWEALENAEVPPDQLANTATGVFVGQCNADYLQRLLWRGDAAIDGYLASGTSPSVTSGRLAYCLGLRGPALTVDTSCSSSLVALHLACRSLRAAETRVALAAGVNLICAPEASIAMSKAHMLAPDGRSKAFDAAADGLGRGEGVAVLVVKRLSDALADGDRVLALVRGSAINQDGRSAGLTVPNGPAQEAVIAAALADAGVSAQAIGYVEAHGTGTSLGDPIEVRALSNALGLGRSAAEPLWIGSVKSNIGHLEGAAGLAGIIKAVLCLQHSRIVPQPLFRTPNPHIPWDQIPIAVAAAGAAWPAGTTRLAGVSSFGFSGTNAHVVLEQAPTAAPAIERATQASERAVQASERAARLAVDCLVLSARSPHSLRALALRYADLLLAGAPLGEVACAAAVGRAHLALRLAVVTHSAATAVDALRAFADGRRHPALLTAPSQSDAEREHSLGGVPNAIRGEAGGVPTARDLGGQYVAGESVNWPTLVGTRSTTRLPNYPFEHQRFWVDVARPARDSVTDQASASVGPFYEVEWRGLCAVSHELSAVSSAAASLASPQHFVPRLMQRFEALVSQHGLEVYDRLAPLLDSLSALHVAAALRTLGFDETPGRVFSPAEEALRLGIAPRHQRLFTRMLEFLAADEVACRVHGGFEIRTPLPRESAQTLHEAVAGNFSNAAGALRMLRRCGAELAGVLTGALDPLPLLFPGGSFAEASLLYVESPAARVYNGALSDAAVAAIAALPSGARLRVLEIGGGTGGTTETLLPLLPADRVDYTFTDVSPLFLERAVERFPSLCTGLLNIERDPAAQGFAAGGYDLVVAANVLHATADIAETLRHVCGLLAPGGLLLCLEAVAAERWSDLTFGMTEGWWRFTDSALRPDHALLSADAWRSCLADAGFTQIHSLGGEPGTMNGRAQQSLLIARAPIARRHLTLVGDAELAAPLAERLRARGDRVSVRDVDATVCDVEDAAEGVGDLVYLGALRLGPQTSAEACTELACAAPLRWLARFGREHTGRTGRAWLVTMGAQAVNGRVTSAGRFQAPLWGVGRVFALERPAQWGGLVDLCPEAALGARLDALLGVLDGIGEEDQIAWRNGRAYVPRLERSRGPRSRALHVRPDATYLVVGGFGGLGLIVGRWLAQQGARHVALLGRTPDMNSAGVAAIRAAGARVIPLAGDVADAARLSTLLEGLAREAPPLKGIVHAATAVSVAPIAELTDAQVAAMLRPKVAGLLALERVAPAVDFTVLFSSTAALTGAMGMAHYAAANAFLDASAQHADRGMLAVNWGSWEIIRAATAAERALLREGGLNALDTAQALDTLGRLIADGTRQMAVANIDWSLLKPLYERSRPRPLLERLAEPIRTAPHTPRSSGTPLRPGTPSAVARTPAPPAPALADLMAALPVADRAEFLETWVRDKIAATLGVANLDRVPPGAGLFDLGMDSLMAVSLQRQLEQGIGRSLPATLTFNHPNARALARYLASLLGESRTAPASAGSAASVTSAASAAPAPSADMRDAEIDAMTDSEVEAQLRARLEQVG